MRTIGKLNIKKVQQATIKEMKTNPGIIDPETIINRMPEAMLDIWEGAHSEISRLIMDTVFKEAHR